MGAHRERPGCEAGPVKTGTKVQAKPSPRGGQNLAKESGGVIRTPKTGLTEAAHGSVCGSPKKLAARKIEGARCKSLMLHSFRNSRGGTRTPDPGIMSAVL